MKKLLVGWLWMMGIFLVSASFLACGGEGNADDFLRADSLNRWSYEQRYKDLEASEQAAREALQVGKRDSSIQAEALNNLALWAFMRMDL